MIGICYRYTANRQLAEDLAHDAFLKAIDKAGSFKGDGVFEGWLRRVVVNHVLTYIRDQKRNRRMDDWLRQESHVVHPDEPGVITDPSEDAEFSAQELLSVINELPVHHRLVFNLYVIDGFKHAQIAEALAISEGTSKSHLARARKKVRQLLAGKAAQKQGRRKIIVLFLLPYNAWRMDRLYNKRFNNLELAHHKALPDFSNAPPVSTGLPYVSGSWINVVAASFVGSVMVVSGILYVTHRENKMRPVKIELTQPILADSVDTKANQEAKYGLISADKKIKSQKTDSSAATLRENSVIQETIKTDRMKTLDSLGIALLMSSGIAFDSVAQSAHEVETSTPNENRKVITGTNSISNNSVSKKTSVVHFSEPAEVRKNRKQEGTFYATSVYWSAEDHEVYFKGKVKVDVGSNNFVSNGSVTFLGKVYLLIIDDKPVEFDSTIMLSQQRYRLTQLNSKEATLKYGERGANGAVEIFLDHRPQRK
jgi:RNA polymerase sigma factor (sigma-70 family)